MRSEGALPGPHRSVREFPVLSQALYRRRLWGAELGLGTGAPQTSRPHVPHITLLEDLKLILAAGGVRRDMLSGLQRQYEVVGPVVGQIGTGGPFVHLYGPDANELVLQDRERMFSARRPWTQIMGKIFPNGLLLMDGHDHAHDRRLMRAPFTRSALRSYTDQLNAMIEPRIRAWPLGEARPRMWRLFKALTLELAAEIFIGVDLGPGSGAMTGAFERMVAASMSRVRLPLPGLTFQRGLQGRAYMQRFMASRIAERREGSGQDLFSRLCRAKDEQGCALGDDEIADHMIFLMMAAHDTTTSTLASMTYELARHPEWQERLREDSRALGSPFADMDAGAQLTRLDWVMREALRRYPPLPVIPRTATRELHWQGYRIGAGTTVVIAPIHTHHMREWWSEPFRFDPERFSPERAEHERHPYMWLPFGGGPHLCLGRRFAEVMIRSILHQMLLRFRWSVSAGYEMPLQQAPISRPIDGLPARLDPI